MIPKEAFAAIAAVMAVSCAFGYVLRGIVDNARKTEFEWFTDGIEADHDRWENDPEPTKNCGNCKHVFKPHTEEPCKGCNKSMHSKWERWG